MFNIIQQKKFAKKIADSKEIKEIIIKYINIDKLHVKSPEMCKEMKLYDFLPDQGTFLISFKNNVHAQTMVLYTNIDKRYIEFDLGLLSPTGEGYPEGSYEYKVISCNLAADNRRSLRIDVGHLPYSISQLSLPKIRETENEIRDTLAIKYIIKTFIEKLDYFDLKVYYDIMEYNNPTEKNIMPELAYALEAGGLYIKNLTKPEIFFDESKSLFKKTAIENNEKNLRSRIHDLSKKYMSLLIEPMEYITTLGDFITLGYVVLATKKKVIDDNILYRTNIIFLETSKILKYGNYISLQDTGNILDISDNGILVEFTDDEPVKLILEHDAMIFNLNLGKHVTPIRVSGSPVYVCSLGNGKHRVGINFQGSQYGPELRRQIQLHLQRDFKIILRTA